MRYVRNLLYFLIGVLFSSWAVFANAETFPATLATAPKTTPIYSSYLVPNQKFYSASEVCTALCATAGAGYTACHVYTPATTATRFLCEYTWANSLQYGEGLITTGCPQGYNDDNGTCKKYTCPQGSTGPAVVGGVLSCTRQDCVAPEVRNATTGLCESPCATKKDQYSSGWVKVAQGGAIPSGTFCNDGCEINSVLSVGDEMLLSKGYDWWPMGQTYTGKSCAAGAPSQNTETTAPAKPAKTPPCASGEGVMTSSSGSVKCVPEGIPDAPKPVVKKEKKAETFPDNTTKTTETTTTTDPNTSATHQSTSTTTSAKPDGTAGQAGAPGTSTSTGGTSTTGGGGNGSGDGDGNCDPKEKMCSKPSTDELYEKKDKTIGSVLGKFSTDMKATPIGKAVEESLNIEVPSSGACPDLSANIPYLNTTIDLAPYICSPTAIEYLEVMGTVLKIMVGYIALTWVFL